MGWRSGLTIVTSSLILILGVSSAPSYTQTHHGQVEDHEMTDVPRRHSGIRILDAALSAMHGDSKSPPQKHPWDDQIELPGNEVIGYDIIMTPAQMEFFRRPDNHNNAENKTETRRRVKRKAISSKQYHWENGIIPYIMDESVAEVSPWAFYVLHSAMQHWMKFTCIKFERYNVQKHGRWANRIKFARGNWCSSHLGKTGGLQYLFIHSNCLLRGTIIHELGHTIGWFHEHARPDRDNYVQVRWDRVDGQTKEQYLKERDFVINTYGIEYDYQSIMHYPNHNGELMTLDPKYQHLLGQREGLSFLDQKLANKMYQCADHCPSSVQCREPGFLNKDCQCVCEDETGSCRVTSHDHVTGSANQMFTDDSDDDDDDQERDCYWRYKSGMAPSVKVKLRLDVENVNECKLQCLQTRDFICRSFHYVYKRFLWYTISSQCLLSADWSKDRRFEATSDGASAIYYETPKCLQKRNFCGWNKTESLLIRVDKMEGKVNYNLSLDECKLTCLEEQDFQCKSFLFRRFITGPTVCVHTRNTKDMSRSESYPRVDYYERKECETNSTDTDSPVTPS